MQYGISRFWHRYRDYLVLGTAVIISFILMALNDSLFIGYMRSGASLIVGSMEEAASYVPALFEAKRENRILKRQLGRLLLDYSRYEEVVQENIRLRDLLGLKKEVEYDVIPAEVIGAGVGGLPGSIHLNVGLRDGCRKNMAIVTPEGVVGKIILVNTTTSIGHIMTDANFRISGRIKRSRVVGIVRWLYGNLCSMDGVSVGADVEVGDCIVTSGYSQIYPGGVEIGRVVEVSDESSGLFKKILIKTAVDFSRLEEVLVVKKKFDNGRQ